MARANRFSVVTSAIVALGGFLMGFDASVISGVVGSIETQFQLSKIELGWGVASLSLSATFAMMVSGPLSDRLGRRAVLLLAATLFLLSALASALAPTFSLLVAARMLGGLGVGAALIIAPMYIAELAPPRVRGRLVSINQLNIVIGISAAFFSNYLILKLGLGDNAWRWMLGVEAVPALAYVLALAFVPESPRWLVMRDRKAEAAEVLAKAGGEKEVGAVLAAIEGSIRQEGDKPRPPLRTLFSPGLRLALLIGVTVGILQQITGINAVFFYAPMIFEQSGIGTDAAFMQAVLVGLTNLVFTIVAMVLIDRLGRRLLLLGGTAGIAICMFVLAYGFSAARYTLDSETLAELPDTIPAAALERLKDRTFESDLAFREALHTELGEAAANEHETTLVAAAIDINPTLILIAILGFVASFAVSLGPVMWVLFSEIFPNTIRGVAISFVGLINSAVSFGVQLIFPWELATLGNATTFLIFGGFAVLGLVIVARILPETRGKSLEELEAALVKA
ncbi:MAG: sugar porter family MFS transporter [Xanthomonadales bacterium]|nr:sugar porter family MFS transporter [Xanthomonadales bacterium]